MRNTKSVAVKLIAFLLAFCVVAGCFTVAAFAEGETVIGKVDPATAVGEYVIPEGTVAIADAAFKDCAELTAITIPASVKTIGSEAFAGCEALASIQFNGTLDTIGANAFRDTAWYNNYPTDFVYASSPSGFNILVGYKGDAEDVSIPVSTTKIADGAFLGNTTIKSVVIPLRTTSVGAFAFYGCSNLSSITVKGSLNECGRMAFEGTAWLENYAGEFIVFGSMLIKYNGNKDLVYIPNTVTKIAAYAFEGCTGVTTVRVPASVQAIGEFAFWLFNDAANGGNTKYAEIYCWRGTYADKYAKQNGLPIAAYMNYPGDVDGNGTAQASDSRIALRYAAKIDRDLSDAAFIAADIDCNGKIESADARIILRMAAKIADYTSEDLLYKPNTDFEILMAYAEGVRLAYIKEAGYKVTEYQSIDDVKIGPSIARTWLNNPFKTELTPEKKAKARTLSSDTVEALEKLYLCDLTNNTIIKSAKCVLTESNKYYITIVLNDELDVDGTDSLTSCIFPVVAREDMQRLLEEKEGAWYNAKNTDFHYNITYTNCTLNAILDVRTGNVENIDMKIGYRFDVWGQMMLTKIYNRDNKNDPVGVATRTDTVKYTDFDYIVKELTMPSTEPTVTVKGEDVDNPVTVPSKDNGGSGFLDTIGDTLGGLLGGLLG